MTKNRATSAVIIGAIAALAIAVGPGTAAGKSKPGLRSFHGTVGVVAKADRAFRLRRSGRSTLRFSVNRSTAYERVSGLAGLRRGLRIEVKARRVNGAWVARKIETEAGDDDAGDDKGGNRARGQSDDPAGDDNGGDRPRGAGDDGPGDDHGGDHG